MRATLPALLLVPAFASANLVINSYYVNPGCGGSDGSINITVAGGQPPYTYAWADGPVIEDRVGLAPGSYSLTVTDATLATEVENVTLVEELNVASENIITYAGAFECPGAQNGSFIVLVEFLPGVPPYTVELTVNSVPWSSSGTDGNGNPIYSGVATNDDVSYTITDANGCSGSDFFPVYGPLGIPPSFVDQQPACGADGGSVLIQPDNSDWLIDMTVYDDAMQVVGETYQTIDPLLLNDLVPGDYSLYVSYTWSMVNGCTPFIIPFTIGDLGPDCGTVNGSSWYDVDADCTHDGGEVPIPYSTLTIQPGDHHVITDGDGTFHYRIVNGDYTLSQDDPTLVPICPVTQPVPFTMNNDVQTIDLANGSNEPLDIVLYTAQGQARPGMTYGILAEMSNPSPQVSGPVTVTFTFDPLLSYVNASPAPASVVGNTITWDVAAFGSFGSASVGANFEVPVATPLGTPLSSTISVSNTLPESTLANNTTVENTIVVSSYDPNDKTARTSTAQSATQYFIDQDEYIDYTIRFQNTGTAEAIDVIVTDTLTGDLDMSSFEQGVASHAFSVAFKPGRVVQWTFAGINLPDSNANEAASHGSLGFRIKPVQPLLAGTMIHNTANIYFDQNPPVITEPSMLNAEFSTGEEQVQGQVQLSVYPNPVNSMLQITLPGDAVSLRIRSGDGREVMSRSGLAGVSTIDVQRLPSGVYSVEVMTAGGGVQRARFIKQ
jgi:uncharacterized repeat protein (TIGR01451 family)